MSRRTHVPMARPRKSSRKKGQAKPADSWLHRWSLTLARWISGPAGRQILALVLIALGVLSLVTIAGLNSGELINAWARFLVQLFGWAAYPMAALIGALGLLWLRHLVHQATAWRWRPFIGFELVLIGLQTLTFALIKQNSWRLIETGRGGGIIGWALYLFFSDYFGPLVTGVFMGFVVLLGLCFAFDLRARDLKEFGQRLAEVWAAFRADWQERAARRRRVRAAMRAEQAAAKHQVASGVVVSPMEKRRPQPAPDERAPAEQGEKPSPKQAKPKPKARRRQATKAPQRFAPLTLLQPSRTSGVNPEEIERKSKIIEETLEQFQVPVRVTEVRKGPTVTQFGVSPGYVNRGSGGRQRKVRVSQISSLADDLALALAAESLRVEAPVPGRAVVGIEVPNSGKSLVTLRAVLESEAFEKCGKPLCFAVGLDVDGSPRVADLSRMPHLLVAGTTGSGKSVFIKALAASLVMYNSPETLRLVAIDPKMVELGHLNGLPHLLGTAESDLEDSLRVLRWVAHEMDRRYKLFSEAVARNLDDYNAKIARRRRRADDEEEEEQPLPRIVVLIDELADLMMSAPEETERTLTRIAQMARATGIHLVVATQRPSTDVVTGLIKANFPARVSFATASVVDSRVILDTTGAESLLGRGDLLFLPPDASAPIRTQGCFISNEEMEAIIRFWQHEVGATPSKAPWEVIAETQGPESWRIEGMDEDADLLEEALDYARKHGKISTSGLQRKLRVGYPRAARLMEQMEEMGVVGPQVSAGRKRRVILGDDEG